MTHAMTPETARAKPASFVWDDPFLMDEQLSAEERMIRDSARDYAQDRLGARVIEAKMTKGNVDILQASWEVTPYDANRTVVAFQIIVDPDMPLPSSLVNSENRKTARKTIRALRALFVPPTAAPAAKK